MVSLSPPLNPLELPALRFPLRLNRYETALMQAVADLSFESRQKLARRVLREHCERKLRAAGIALPGRG